MLTSNWQGHLANSGGEFELTLPWCMGYNEGTVNESVHEWSVAYDGNHPQGLADPPAQ